MGMVSVETTVFVATTVTGCVTVMDAGTDLKVSYMERMTGIQIADVNVDRIRCIRRLAQHLDLTHDLGQD